MKQVAPVPPACPDWSGFYIGGFGGYKFSTVDSNLDLNGLWTRFPEGRDAIESRAPRDVDNSGGEAGGLVGYNYQWRRWVFGLEGDAGYLWARDSRDSGIIAVDSGDGYDVHTSFKTRYLATFGPRVGYTFCRWMPYITGGLAVGDLDYRQHFSNIFSRSIVGFTFHDEGSEQQTNVGWMVGGGLEYALTDHWHIRGQYQYIDLGSVDFNTAGFGNISFDPAFTAHHEASLREHNASFAITYKF